MQEQEFDEIKEEHNKLPLGWVLFFIGVIAWLIYYIVAYTPGISGWSFNKNFDESMKAEAPAMVAEAPMGNPYSGDHAAAEEGEGIYASYCAACHGEEMEDPAVGVDLKAALSYGSSEADLFESVDKGRPNGMPPFGQQLGADRTWKVVTYIVSEREED
jgi:cytochrome c oxidase cbb3-type subunit 3